MSTGDYYTEFNLGLGHFARAHEMFRQCDICDVQLRADHFISAKTYVATMRRLWFILRMPCKIEKIRERMDDEIERLQDLVNSEFKRLEEDKDAGFRYSTILALEKYDKELGHLAQDIGMGIKIEKQLSKKEKGERMLR